MTTTPQVRTRRDQAINIRASLEQRELIDRAATAMGKSRSEFMVESATREAQQVLLDRTVFTLSPEAHSHFVEILETAVEPTEELRALMAMKAPWE